MKRLYVLTDNQLEPIYAAVQGGHCVAQWLIEHPEGDWKNNYLIYLAADVNKWKDILDSIGIDYSSFHEPDLNDRLTAIASTDIKRLVKGLPLLKT